MHTNILLFFRLVGGIGAHYTSFEILDPPSFICMMTERMDDWNPPKTWKRITCIMIIHASHHCDGDYEAVARRKQHSR